MEKTDFLDSVSKALNNTSKKLEIGATTLKNKVWQAFKDQYKIEKIAKISLIANKMAEQAPDFKAQVATVSFKTIDDADLDKLYSQAESLEKIFQKIQMQGMEAGLSYIQVQELTTDNILEFVKQVKQGNPHFNTLGNMIGLTGEQITGMLAGLDRKQVLILPAKQLISAEKNANLNNPSQASSLRRPPPSYQHFKPAESMPTSENPTAKNKPKLK